MIKKGLTLSINTIIVIGILIGTGFVYAFETSRLVDALNTVTTLTLNYLAVYQALSYFSSVYRAANAAAFSVDTGIFSLVTQQNYSKVQYPIVKYYTLMEYSAEVPQIVPLGKPTKYSNYILLPHTLYDAQRPSVYFDMGKAEKIGLGASKFVVLTVD